MSARQAARWKRAACPALARDSFSKSKIWRRNRGFGFHFGELRLSKPLTAGAGERPGGARRHMPLAAFLVSHSKRFQKPCFLRHAPGQEALSCFCAGTRPPSSKSFFIPQKVCQSPNAFPSTKSFSQHAEGAGAMPLPRPFPIPFYTSFSNSTCVSGITPSCSTSARPARRNPSPAYSERAGALPS